MLEFGLVQPLDMQLYVANADGSNARRVKTLNGTSFAPFFLPNDDGMFYARC